jgi:hypothetical protein
MIFRVFSAAHAFVGVETGNGNSRWWTKDVARLFLFTIIPLLIILYNALYQETHTFRPLPISLVQGLSFFQEKFATICVGSCLSTGKVSRTMPNLPPMFSVICPSVCPAASLPHAEIYYASRQRAPHNRNTVLLYVRVCRHLANQHDGNAPGPA